MMEDHAPGQEKHFSSGEQEVGKDLPGPAELGRRGRGSGAVRGPWGQCSACGGALRAAASRVLQNSQENAARGSHSAAQAEEPLGARGIPLLQLCKCVCVCVHSSVCYENTALF